MNDRHEVLFTQLSTYRSEVLHAAASVTPEEADVIPPPFRNNIRWNLGHIYLDQYQWIEALTKEKQGVPETYPTWFGYGTSPHNFTQETPSLQTLSTQLKEQPGMIRERWGHRMEEAFPQTEMGMRTVEQVFIRTVFHEGMHLQTILDIKKALSQ
ncbi:hypothetical protein AF331_09345 [Rossellomorea marisflavi]|uniref:DinB-like domain-containing protein n=1 Tax=Rossellomorea marisflavi TaxID=189381 RepID=A0A0M0GM46_9BACI|nr:DinB family protein [Rossellomorea marisflavi]KON90567.1 hypothetical protein AF331_09345 [Rossellomorea marisflavi]